MSRSSSRNTTIATLGALLAGSLASGAAGAEPTDNPFALSDLDRGYQVAGAKDSEGKCGEGKCGGDKDDDSRESGSDGKDGGEGKCGEGKCGG